MKPLDQKLLKEFIKLAGDRLTGEWVLIGGTVLLALEAGYRSTVDIDLVGLGKRTQSDTLLLMEIAEELGLPVESINQAGAYFLQKIPGFERHLVLLHRGRAATLYRPDAILYFRLKLARFSESDFTDCVEYLRFASDAEKIGAKKLLSTELKTSNASKERAKRIQALLVKLQLG